MWNFITPQLPVADVEAAQRYYRDVLGFQIAWTREDYGAVICGTTEIFFARSDDPQPGTWCCVRVDDADALYERYKQRGAVIAQDLESKPWGIREFTLEDPNGHFFRVGQVLR